MVWSTEERQHTHNQIFIDTFLSHDMVASTIQYTNKQKSLSLA